MKFLNTNFEGLYLIEPEVVKDDRGIFFRTYCADEFRVIGFQEEFVQMNHASNYKAGTLRGMHAQKSPYQEIKLVRCVKGAVWDVVIDLRQNSNTFLQYYATELSEQNAHSILIPKGFAHGYLTLTDHCDLIYHHTSHYTPGHEFCVRYDDPFINIEWPEKVKKISQKDLSYLNIDQTFKGL
ncbi:MAG: dTDP-4-dehydrorhamnose 3,5-epimerase [Saprospiraceae bacterium]|nr:dTDP-4-dehydrorhamnose 3,5-epimerase [Saprospiraceae bacterium]MBK7811439.1 dTDP-4-dehydrorhamnose 3,5-epimerase [Saprospiraceae bacterium]